MNKIYLWSLRLQDNVSQALTKVSGYADNVSNRFSRVQDQINRTSSVASSLKGAFAGVLAGASFTMLATNIFQATASAQSFQVAMNTMLGSKEKADQLVSQVTEFASKTPFELAEVKSATQKLIAFGVNASDVKGTLQALGDVSAGIGAPIAEIAEVYGKAKVQGRLFAEDINQLTGRGIPIIGELARQFGTTEGKVKELVEKGQVHFDHLKKAMESMSGPGGKFHKMMEEQSKTLGGQWSNVKDKVTQFLVLIGNKLLPVFEKVFSVLSSGIDWFTRNFSTIKDVFMAIFTGIKAALVVFSPLLLMIGLVTIAVWAQNAAWLANPLTWVALTIVGVITAFQLLWNKVEGFRGFLMGVWASIKQIFTSLGDIAFTVLGGIGDMLGGLFTGNFYQMREGMKGLKDGLSKIGSMGVADAFNKAYEQGAAQVKARNEEKKEKSTLEKLGLDDKSGSSAKLPDPSSTTPGLTNELQKGNSSITAGSQQIRNVTVNITRLVENFNINTSNLGSSMNQVREMVTEEIVRAVSGAESVLSHSNG